VVGAGRTVGAVSSGATGQPVVAAVAGEVVVTAEVISNPTTRAPTGALIRPVRRSHTSPPSGRVSMMM